MIKKLLLLSIPLVFSTASVLAEGNISTGKAKSSNCISCHGEGGNSMLPTFPKLAGQHPEYIEKQLQAFKSNDRNSPMMAPLAMGLSKQSIEDIAAFYASIKVSSNPFPTVYDDDDDEVSTDDVKKLISLGNDLYRNGDLETKVSACIACHGPFGEGNKAASFPALKGQHADYLIKTLTDFKKGSRSNIPNSMMHLIAKKMTDKEIQAVSYHISMMK